MADTEAVLVRGLLSLVLLVGAQARAELTVGDGHWGALTVTEPNQQLNRYLRLDADVGLGSPTLSAVGEPVKAGDLLLIVQMKDNAAAPGDRTTPAVDLTTMSGGRYVWARATSVAGSVVTLDSPLTRAFPSVNTQVVVTPEYTSLTVLDGGSIVAAPWDGFTGGIVALVAQTEVKNDGQVLADRAGYRGGTAMPYQTDNPDGGQCHELVEPFPLGSMSGEGLEAESAPRFGRAPSLLGGGAGGCTNGAGAGGSLVGRGGRGGDGQPGEDNGGLEPPSVSFSPRTQLLLGGGGGSGWSHPIPYAVGSCSGAPGGGAILVHANHIAGAGVWSANGGSPESFGGGDWGYGGGGAGGTIVLRSKTNIECGDAFASGGQGGREPNGKGPGGGGGGGMVFFEALGSMACPASALAGRAGVDANGAKPASATDPSYVGTSIISKPIQDNGEPPTFTSTPNTTAYCGTPYRYSNEHVPVLSSAGPYHFAISAQGQRVPDDLTLNADTGEITWRPGKSEVGAYVFVLSASSAYGTATQTIEVSVECDSPAKSKVGCSCDSVPSVLGLTVLAMLWRRRHARDSRHG